MATNTDGPATPTNLPGGVNTSYRWQTTGLLPTIDPSNVYMFFDDFTNYWAANTGTVANWMTTITQAGAGNASALVTQENGGVVLITNDDADDDNYFAQWKGGNSAAVAETFRFEGGKQLWFKARFKVSDATQSDAVIGLQIADTTPLAVTDGVYFLKADGSTTLNLLVTKNSTSTTTAATTLVSDTYVIVGFYYNGYDKIDIYVNNNRVASSVTTNLVDDEDLAVSFGIQNGEAAAKTMSIDYILAVKER